MNQLVAFALYLFCLSVVVILFRRAQLKTPLLMLFKVLFPSWRFFEEAGLYPVLYYRYSNDKSDLGNWKPCLMAPARAAKNLLFNPEGQIYFAYNSLLHQLANEIQNSPNGSENSISSSVSFQLVNNIVTEKIHKKIRAFSKNIAGSFTTPITSRVVSYQFKLQATSPAGWEDKSEDMLLSAVYEVQV